MSPLVLVFFAKKDLGSSSTHKWNWECGSRFSSSKQKKNDSLSLEPVPKIRPNFDLIFLTWTGRSSSSHLRNQVPAQHCFKLANWSVEGDPSKGSNLSTWSGPSDPVLSGHECGGWDLRVKQKRRERERERERRWGSTCSSSSSNLYFPGSSNNCFNLEPLLCFTAHHVRSFFYFLLLVGFGWAGRKGEVGSWTTVVEVGQTGSPKYSELLHKPTDCAAAAAQTNCSSSRRSSNCSLIHQRVQTNLVEKKMM